ncbi:MAG: hypothetical protein ABUT20_48730 [Bacteroidota bacterium]
MKRKNIYTLILICFLGLISSANQANKECTKTALCYTEKANCCPGAPAETAQTDSPTVPLNLFLFDL